MGHSRIYTMSLALAAVLTVGAALAQNAGAPETGARPRLSASGAVLRDGALTVDGAPFFLMGTWGTVRSPKFMREYRFNCVLGYFAQSLRTLADDERAGLWHIPYLQANQWEARRCEKVFTSLVGRPGILCWNLGDDMGAQHVEDVRRYAQWIRRNDPLKRPIMLDFGPGPANAPPVSETMAGAYYYPLLHTTLADYQQELRQQHALLGDDRYFWTWVQTHTQDDYNRLFLSNEVEEYGRTRPYMYPDPELVRLLCYHALAAGARGLMFFPARFFPPEIGGGARLAEFAILASELEIMGPWLVSRLTLEKMRCTPPAAATCVDVPGATVLLLVAQGLHYEYHPDAAWQPGTTVHVDRAFTKEMRALRLDFPEARELRIERGDNGMDIEIGPWELTAAVLLSDDTELLRRAQHELRQRLPRAARFAVEVARTKAEHAARTDAELRSYEIDVTRLADREELQRVGEAIAEAEALLGRKAYADAYVGAREAQRRLRRQVRRCWERMWTDPVLDFAAHGRAAPGAPIATRFGLQDFFLMPMFYRIAHAERHGKTSANLVQNPSFEDIVDTRFIAWDTAIVAKHLGGGRHGAGTEARTGRAAFAVTSSRPARDSRTDEEVDWATYSAMSARIPANVGDVVDASVWVRIDSDFMKTQRGAILNLVAWDADGRPVGDWSAGRIETGRHRRTQGWTRLRLRRVVNQPSIRRIALRLATCGVGSVLFDDAVLTLTALDGRAEKRNRRNESE